jgi:hypothetical protein
MLDPRTGEQLTIPTEEEQEAITGGGLNRYRVPPTEGGNGTLPDTKLFQPAKPGRPGGPPEAPF